MSTNESTTDLQQKLRVATADLAKAQYDLELVRSSRLWRVCHQIMAAAKRLLRPEPPTVPDTIDIGSSQPVVLMIDTHLPLFDKDSGGLRITETIRVIQSLGYHVVFVPDDGGLPEPYTSKLRSSGVTVLGSMSPDIAANDALTPILPRVTVAWVCRPHPCRKYFPRLLRYANISLVYDTHDVHYIRLRRQEEYAAEHGKVLRSNWQQIKELELTMARLANRTVVLGDADKAALEAEEITNTVVLSNVNRRYAGEIPGFEGRSGLLFIGSYKHEPNVDAVLWFCRDIFPLIRREHPDITLTLLGSDPPPEVRHLQSKDVNVTGYVADVTEYFLQSKVFVCPLLFGAGVKGKVGQSLSFGLPVVSTSVGVEGMNVEAGCEALVADTAEEFARAVLQAYTDETLWNNLSAQGYKMVEEYSGERLRGLIDTLFKDLESRGNGTAAE